MRSLTAERERMLTQVAQDAERALAPVRQAGGLLDEEAVKAAHDLLREWIGQDFEIDPDSVPRLHRGTASDRIIFAIDLENGTVSCPAGHTVAVAVSAKGFRQASFSAKVCSACPLKAQCCPGRARRQIKFGDHDELLLPARQALPPQTPPSICAARGRGSNGCSGYSRTDTAPAKAASRKREGAIAGRMGCRAGQSPTQSPTASPSARRTILADTIGRRRQRKPPPMMMFSTAKPSFPDPTSSVAF